MNSLATTVIGQVLGHAIGFVLSQGPLRVWLQHRRAEREQRNRLPHAVVVSR